MPTKSWCNICGNEMLRIYIRKQVLLNRWRRTFVAIGWYCDNNDKCRVFQVDEKGLEDALELRRFFKYRIYLRWIDKARRFIPFAYYYLYDGLFELDKSKEESSLLKLRVKYNAKTNEEAIEADKRYWDKLVGPCPANLRSP